MNTALVPYLLSPAGGTGGVAQTSDAHRFGAPGLEPAGRNIAFYFRNWPFPVDMVEPGTADGEHRSWQERLASYRAASQDAARPAASEGPTPSAADEKAVEVTPLADDGDKTGAVAAKGAETVQAPQAPAAPPTSAADENPRQG